MYKDEIASNNQYSDAELIKQWPGFENRYEDVNGINLHYVRRKRKSSYLSTRMAPNLVFF